MTHAVRGVFRDYVANGGLFRKTLIYFGCQVYFIHSRWRFRLHLVPKNTVNTIQIVLTQFRHRNWQNRPLNYPLGQKLSGISIYGTTRFPQWEVGHLGKIAWEVPLPRGVSHEWVYLYV